MLENKIDMRAEYHGCLFVVATPIGNMDDITFRAVRVLSFVDLVVAEDTRLTGRLLRHYGIKTKLLSMNEFNEVTRVPEILRRINSNINVAVVSSAGTPLISDPGFRLLGEAIKSFVKIVPIPGVSAVTTSLSVAGLPTDAFIFMGFPPRKKGKRLEKLRQIAFEQKTLIFYESPKRIIAFLHEAMQILGDRDVVLSREMTKIHEEFIRGKISDVMSKLRNKGEIKGECTLLFSGQLECGTATDIKDVFIEIKGALLNASIRTSALSKRLAERYGISKTKAYKMILEVKDTLNS